jgi:murein DD-endopeptidase MepM/ murein hydrolase activator NlpD
MDIAMPERTSLVAVFDGTVSDVVVNDHDYGTYIVITDSEGRTAFYAHLECMPTVYDGIANAIDPVTGEDLHRKLQVGDFVRQSQVIAYSGGNKDYSCSGVSMGTTGLHLHFELSNDPERALKVDPNDAMIAGYGNCPVNTARPPP